MFSNLWSLDSSAAQAYYFVFLLLLSAYSQEFDQQTALQLLLAKETRLLQTLDKLRLNAKHENKARHMEKALGTMSQPQTWTLSNGKKVWCIWWCEVLAQLR